MTTAAFEFWVAGARSVRVEHEVARRGVKLKGNGIERVGPCPVCGGTDRFSVNVKKQLWNCRGCAKGGDVIDLAMHCDGVDFKTACATLNGELPPQANRKGARRSFKPSSRDGNDNYERRQHLKAGALWFVADPLAGSVAEKYLREARGISCALPATLAFVRDYRGHPALVAAFALPDEPEPGTLAMPRRVESVQLTFLKPDGSGKADVEPCKITVGSPAALPLVLAPVNDLLGLAICEGVEDALSVAQATGLGAWASAGASRMPALADVVPRYVEAVTIYAHDEPAGRKGAEALANALVNRVKEVRITEPQDYRIVAEDNGELLEFLEGHDDGRRT
jgi:putative DNA primase/helicase